MGNGFLLWQNGGGGGSLPVTETTEYELLADIEVTGSATTNVYINGLNIGKGDEVVLVSDVVNTSGSTRYYLLSTSNNTTTTNYYRQSIYADGASTGGSRDNINYFVSARNNTKSLVTTKIKLTNNGYFVWQADITCDSGLSTMYLASIYGTSTFTSNVVSSLTITADGANGIGIGSRFQLYRATGEVTQTWATV